MYPTTWDVEPYLGDKGYLPHPKPRAAYAAMISHLDNQIGELIEKLVDKYYFPGNYSILFNAKQYPSGMYLYRLKSGESNYTKKFMILK